jgi:hypothetical protein
LALLLAAAAAVVAALAWSRSSEKGVPPGPQEPASSAVLRRLLALEVRVEKLERGGGAGAGIDPQELKAALAEVRAIERAQRTEVHVRQRLAQNGVVLDPTMEPTVVRILSGYTGALLAVREEPAAGGPAMRYQGALAARERMVQELRALLPASEAERLIALYPPPPEPAGPGPEGGDREGG